MTALVDAIASVRLRADLDAIGKEMWRAYAAGEISEEAAEALSAAIEARRQALGATPARGRSTPVIARPRRARSPDRETSIRRRRALAAWGIIPPSMAPHFTQGEIAVLTVIGTEILKRGRCELPIDQIAALAGVSRTTAQNALRVAKKLGLITVTERRRHRRPSLTNLVEVISAEWKTWLARRGEGSKSRAPRNTESKTPTATITRRPLVGAIPTPLSGAGRTVVQAPILKRRPDR